MRECGYEISKGTFVKAPPFSPILKISDFEAFNYMVYKDDDIHKSKAQPNRIGQTNI